MKPLEFLGMCLAMHALPLLLINRKNSFRRQNVKEEGKKHGITPMPGIRHRFVQLNILQSWQSKYDQENRLLLLFYGYSPSQ